MFISLHFFGFIYICFSTIESKDIKVKSLCEDPLIHSADRLVNKTVRVYRGDYYWELKGLPAQTVKVDGPFKIWNLNMGTFRLNNAMVTLLEGTDIGSTYKTESQRYWAWDKDGNQFAGAFRGNFWDLIPVGGFEAAFHNGNKENPTVIAFKDIHVYYFSTKDKVWSGDKKGYNGGKYDEDFPPDLTAAFSWPADDPKDEYIVYLFKRKNYCKRTKLNKNCQWIDNRVLFGCSSQSGEQSDGQQMNSTNSVQVQLSSESIQSVPTPTPMKSEPNASPDAGVTEGQAIIQSKGSYIFSSNISLICLLICFNLRFPQII